MKGKIPFGILLLCSSLQLSQSCKKNGYYRKDSDNQHENTVNTVDSFLLVDPNYVNGYWKEESGAGSSSIAARVATYTVPKLTQKIFSSGTVLTYIKVPNGLYSTVEYASLPFTFELGSAGYSARLASTYEPGKLRIYYFYNQPVSGGTTPPNLASVIVPTYLFKYVIIPGPEGY